MNLNLPPNVACHHIDTTRQPDGSYRARFRFFASPAPPALVKAFARCGFTVRRVGFDGQQTELTIVYEEQIA